MKENKNSLEVRLNAESFRMRRHNFNLLFVHTRDFWKVVHFLQQDRAKFCDSNTFTQQKHNSRCKWKLTTLYSSLREQKIQTPSTQEIRSISIRNPKEKGRPYETQIHMQRCTRARGRFFTCRQARGRGWPRWRLCSGRCPTSPGNSSQSYWPFVGSAASCRSALSCNQGDRIPGQRCSALFRRTRAPISACPSRQYCGTRSCSDCPCRRPCFSARPCDRIAARIHLVREKFSKYYKTDCDVSDWYALYKFASGH